MTKEDSEAEFKSQELDFKLFSNDKITYDVEYVILPWLAWREEEAKRKADGWTLAYYGQRATTFAMSGYFKRAKQPKNLSPEWLTADYELDGKPTEWTKFLQSNWATGGRTEYTIEDLKAAFRAGYFAAKSE